MDLESSQAGHGLVLLQRLGLWGRARSGGGEPMVTIVRAVAGEAGIPLGFPILFDRDMAIIDALNALRTQRAPVLSRGAQTGGSRADLDVQMRAPAT